ncbi:MAG: UDP-N-acetylmuramoyl-L-alanine--D-glutamate ligase [Pseudomonadota bacterium]
MNAAAQTLNSDDAMQADTLVYGLGGTGLSVARCFERQGRDALYFDTREAPPGLAELRSTVPSADVVLGELPRDRLAGLKQVVVSPGIADSDPNLQALRAGGIEVVSDIDLFVAEAPGEFVAITGSNGKSTVTTLVEQMCNAAGCGALAGGNLGLAALDLLAEPLPSLYVLELSSFQLQRTRELPASVAVLLNLSPDHIDWHGSEAAYAAAKYRIFAEASAAVINREDADVLAHTKHISPVVTFGADEPAEAQFGLRRVDGQDWLARGADLLMPVAEIALVGRHNHLNALAALAVCDLLGLEMVPLLDVLRTFAGLPHRMQFVRELDGVRYINDSKATNVGAAIASVTSVDGPVVLLAGGQGKGGDFGTFAATVGDRLRTIVLFGEDADLLAGAFKGHADILRAADLESALLAARTAAQPGDTVLLAPACASFDQFVNYLRRGDAFCELVEGLSP